MGEFLERPVELERAEGKEMFALLVLSLTANEILRKFSTEAKLQWAHQISDLKSVRNEATIARREVDGKYYAKIVSLQGKVEAVGERNGELLESLERVNGILQGAATTQNNFGTIFQCIQNVNTGLSWSNEADYVLEVERVLEAKNAELLAAMEENAECVQRLEATVEECEDARAEGDAAQKARDAAQLAEVEWITSALTRSEQQMRQLQEEKGVCELRLGKIEGDQEHVTNDLRWQQLGYQKEIEQVKDSYDSLFEDQKREATQLRREVEDVKALFTQQMATEILNNELIEI
jgi:hypothetical protein